MAGSGPVAQKIALNSPSYRAVLRGWAFRPYEALPGYFEKKLVPALRALLDAAAMAGEVRGDVEPYDLLRAVGDLGMSAHDDGPAHARRMVALLVDGLRFGATQWRPKLA